ncbi:hypothetical protein CAFE_17390 [Caprobacter fermentans]|nr:hypothetical protein [Caproicibacter fermentans]
MKKKFLAFMAGLLILFLAAFVGFTKFSASPTGCSNTNSFSLGTGSASKTQPLGVTDLPVSKLTGKAEQILKTKNLSYDEGYLFTEDGDLCEVTGAAPLTDLDEIHQYYPKWTIPKTFKGYQFHDFIVGMNTLNPIYQSVEDPNENPGKVFQRDISFSHAGYAAIRYVKGENLLTITITDSNKTPAPCTDEQLKQTGRFAEYTILNGLPGLDHYCYGYRFNTEDNKYTVEVSSAQIHQDASETEMSSEELKNYNTVEGMRELMDELNLKENLHTFTEEI